MNGWERNRVYHPVYLLLLLFIGRLFVYDVHTLAYMPTRGRRVALPRTFSAVGFATLTYAATSAGSAADLPECNNQLFRVTPRCLSLCGCIRYKVYTLEESSSSGGGSPRAMGRPVQRDLHDCRVLLDSCCTRSCKSQMNVKRCRNITHIYK